jgi:hypothetical protein
VRLVEIHLVEQLHAAIRHITNIEDGIPGDLALDVQIPLLYVSIRQVRIDDIGRRKRARGR